VLLSTGIGLESTMRHVADSDYGEVSYIFDRILREAADGHGYLKDSLKEAAQRTSSEALKKAINTMIMGSSGEIDLVESLEKLAEKETRRRKLAITRYIEKLSSMTEFYLILGILVPIMVVTMVFVDLLIDPIWGSMFPDWLLTALLGAVVVVLALIISFTKIAEPGV